MANDTVITVVGNLTGDPEVRFTTSGTAVANFTVASTPRHFDKQRQEWVEDEALFLRCSVWREYAEHVAESLSRGTRVVVVGKLRQRGWEDKEGNKRTSYELDVDEVAPSLRWATAKVQKMQRQSQGQTDGSAWDTPNAVPNGDSSIPF
jgi:single-strand DNA-binding protein